MSHSTFISEKKNIIMPVAFGNTLEWYDFFLYAYLTPVFTKLFFPSQSTTAALLSAFAVFTVGFCTRPIGSIIFGHTGDKLGRKKTLAITITLMGISTAAIGCLPTYSQVGIYAPILLIICRLLQGISLGGENTGNAVYIIEQSPPGKHGLFGSFSVFGTFLGAALASGVTVLVSKLSGGDALLNWTWRIPFWIGLLAAGLGLYFRLKMPETPEFLAILKQKNIAKMPVILALQEKPLMIFKMFIVLSAAASIYFMAFIFLPTFANVNLGLPLSQSLLATSINNLIGLCLVIPVGYWSDKIGRKPIIIGAFLGLCILSYPLFLLASQASFISLWLAQLVFHILFVLLYTTLIAVVCEVFAAKIRYSATSLANGFGSIIASLIPIIATSIISITHNFAAPSYVLIFLGLIGLGVILTIHETYQTKFET